MRRKDDFPTFLILSLGQPSTWFGPIAGLTGGLGRASVSSGTSEIKREDKEDDENTSVADNSEEEKKELKPSRTRTRCSLNRSQPFSVPFGG